MTQKNISLISKKYFFVFVSILVLSIYGQSLKFDFVYDDVDTILNNPSVHSLKNAARFFYDKTTTSRPDISLIHEIYRPLKNLSIAIDFFVYGRNPFGFHFTNILLHLLACFLFFKLLTTYNQFHPFIPYFSTILLAIHPSVSHNVAYISGRADIILAVFILGCLFNLKKGCFKTSYFLYAFACLSKEAALALPLFLFIYYVAQSKNIRKILPFFLIAGIYFLCRQIVLEGSLEQTTYFKNSFWLTQATMSKSWFHYFSGFWWPHYLEILPGISREVNSTNYRVLSSLFFLLLATLFLIWTFKHSKKESALSLIWFIIFILPVANIIPIKAFFSWRFFYLPLMGLCVFSTLFIQRFIHKDLVKIVFSVWLILIGYQSFLSVSQFKNSKTLWQPVIKKYPTLTKPYRVLARFHLTKKEIPKAQYFLEKGLEKSPSDSHLLLDSSHLLLTTDKINEAIELLKKIKIESFPSLELPFLKQWIHIGYHKKNWELIINKYSSFPGKVHLLDKPNLLKVCHAYYKLNHIIKAKDVAKLLIKHSLNQQEKKYVDDIFSL